MKIVCSQAELSKGVNIVSKAVPTRTTMAILECILIDASSDEIKLIANDMEIAIETVIEGRVEERGIIAIDARFFGDVVRNLPNNDVTIETNDKLQTTITCEKALFSITGKSGEDFPNMPMIQRNQPIVISQFTLRETIRQTIFSTSDSDKIKILTGELFEISGNKLKVVSLDGHRVSIRNILLKDSYEDKKVIVPGKTLQEIRKIISGSTEDNTNIFITDNHIIFEFDKTVVVSRLLEGDYFNIDQMISTDYETKVKINKKDLYSSITRSTLMVKEEDKKPIIMNVEDNKMNLKISSFFGKFDESIDISKEGKNLQIGFNPKFFIDALNVIDDEEVTIYMLDYKNPCMIKNDNEDYIYVILPVNIRES
ncbi:MAG: DNA polymerase III subunit beta [Lachnospiraceae bacterium]|nr:DNA polymerase III subunit beta [Lachnospiraceae bacterium]